MAKMNDVEFGEKDILGGEGYDRSQATVLISLRVPGDVLHAYKEMAKQDKDGRGYQTIMIEALRNGLKKRTVGRDDVIELLRNVKGTVSRIEKDMIADGAARRAAATVAREMRGSTKHKRARKSITCATPSGRISVKRTR